MTSASIAQENPFERDATLCFLVPVFALSGFVKGPVISLPCTSCRNDYNVKLSHAPRRVAVNFRGAASPPSAILLRKTAWTKGHFVPWQCPSIGFSEGSPRVVCNVANDGERRRLSRNQHQQHKLPESQSNFSRDPQRSEPRSDFPAWSALIAAAITGAFGAYMVAPALAHSGIRKLVGLNSGATRDDVVYTDAKFPVLESPVLPVEDSWDMAKGNQVRDLIPLPAKSLRVRENFVVNAVKKVGPAVVRIDTERTVSRPSLESLDGDLYRFFFGDDASPNSGPRVAPPRKERGQGSGIIVDTSGLVITNSHVVKGAQKVTITLTDGRVFEGKVMGTDELLDLAVIRIESQGKPLPAAELGDSDSLQVGDWAIAVGNPLGLDNTVTMGIVSSIKRSSAEVGIPDKRLDFIQTDCAINPGNSGGPLLNELGDVIGINTAIRANAEGIGFAIPVNKVKQIKDALSRGEAIKHPYIGIQMVTLTPELARRSNVDPNSGIYTPEVEGVLVVRVLPNTPAAAAGVRRGDVVVEVDGHRVKNTAQLQKLVEAASIGQKLKLRIMRGDVTKVTISVPTAEIGSAKELKEAVTVP